MMTKVRYNDVGFWTEIKLQIIKEYAAAYSIIMKKQAAIRGFGYIDAFAGPGKHISRETKESIKGSPMIALEMGFSECHFIDKNRSRVKALRELTANKPNVHVYHGDCNVVLVNEVFPQYTYESRKRALCLLDPYELNPNWEVVNAAGATKTIEIFLNFSIMDANMNVFKHNQDKVNESQIRRMNVFWGDDSWKNVAYNKVPTLFGEWDEKTSNEAVASAYKARLRDVAGFRFVPDPIPMKNSTGAIIYYIFFASHNETGYKIARSIFNKYRGN